jgi:hypothetical protein
LSFGDDASTYFTFLNEFFLQALEGVALDQHWYNGQDVVEFFFSVRRDN